MESPKFYWSGIEPSKRTFEVCWVLACSCRETNKPSLLIHVSHLSSNFVFGAQVGRDISDRLRFLFGDVTCSGFVWRADSRASFG